MYTYPQSSTHTNNTATSTSMQQTYAKHSTYCTCGPRTCVSHVFAIAHAYAARVHHRTGSCKLVRHHIAVPRGGGLQHANEDRVTIVLMLLCSLLQRNANMSAQALRYLSALHHLPDHADVPAAGMLRALLPAGMLLPTVAGATCTTANNTSDVE